MSKPHLLSAIPVKITRAQAPKVEEPPIINKPPPQAPPQETIPIKKAAKKAVKKKATQKAPAPPAPSLVLVYQFQDFPISATLATIHGYPDEKRSYCGYLYPSRYGDLDIFERHPEPDMSQQEIRSGFAYQSHLHDLIWPALSGLGIDPNPSYRYGYHVTASFEQAVESVERAKLQPLSFRELYAEHIEGLRQKAKTYVEQQLAKKTTPYEIISQGDPLGKVSLGLALNLHGMIRDALQRRGIDPLEAMVAIPEDAYPDYPLDARFYLVEALMENDRPIELAIQDPKLAKHRLQQLLRQTWRSCPEAPAFREHFKTLITRKDIRSHVGVPFLFELDYTLAVHCFNVLEKSKDPNDFLDIIELGRSQSTDTLHKFSKTVYKAVLQNPELSEETPTFLAFCKLIPNVGPNDLYNTLSCVLQFLQKRGSLPEPILDAISILPPPRGKKKLPAEQTAELLALFNTLPQEMHTELVHILAPLGIKDKSTKLAKKPAAKKSK